MHGSCIIQKCVKYYTQQFDSGMERCYYLHYVTAC